MLTPIASSVGISSNFLFGEKQTVQSRAHLLLKSLFKQFFHQAILKQDVFT
jgi:hypothetical protein